MGLWELCLFQIGQPGHCNVGQRSLQIPCSSSAACACLRASFLWVSWASNAVTMTWRKALEQNAVERVRRGVDGGL